MSLVLLEFHAWLCTAGLSSAAWHQMGRALMSIWVGPRRCSMSSAMWLQLGKLKCFVASKNALTAATGNSSSRTAWIHITSNFCIAARSAVKP